MRVAAGSAAMAARPIAQISWRVVMALTSPSFSAVKIAEQGKVRVNRLVGAPLLAEGDASNQAKDRAALLSI
jgi:hypothetical protein